MKIFNGVLAVCAALLIFTQCAKTENENLDEREQAVFDMWMERNGPEDAQRQDNGMYIRWIHRSGSGKKLALNNFMYLDYKGRDLDGNLYSTRDSAVAVHENTFSLYTRYTPHYAVFNKEAYYFTQGEYEALSLMDQGDTVEVYMPSMLAYNTTTMMAVTGATFMGDLTYGYTGWFNSTLNPRNTVGSSTSAPSFNYKPVIIELTLDEVVADPQARELSDATSAADALGYNTQDTIRTGLFFRYVDDEDGVSGEDTASELIGEDSTFYFEYSLRFLDDFLIATNVDTVASLTWGDYWNTYAPSTFTAASGQLLPNSNISSYVSTYYISALNELIKSERVRYNSRMQIIFISDWAYGPYGFSATSTQPIIFPYVPLKLDITTMPYDYDPDEE